MVLKQTKLPSIEFEDIFNFLVVQTSFYMGKQIKGYKALEAYNYFTSGVVTEVKLRKRVKIYIFTIMAYGYERKWRLHLVQSLTFSHRKHLIPSEL